ncbi:MAG: hypothetical protein ABTQ73_10985 [Caldilineales bacterium]
MIPLLAFALLVVLLYLLQRHISRALQSIGLLLFDSHNAGMVVLWFALLPGIMLHELSHWLMAQLLGIPTGRLRLSPTMHAQQIVLGSVEVKRADPLRDSLIGLAPFLAGTLALLAIGYGVFDAAALGLAWENGDWANLWATLEATRHTNDAWLWIYLIFAISNAMMPSPSDRESWRLLLIYMALIALIMLLFGWFPAIPTSWIAITTAALRTLTYALALALLVDVAVAAVLTLSTALLAAARHRKLIT